MDTRRRSGRRKQVLDVCKRVAYALVMANTETQKGNRRLRAVDGGTAHHHGIRSIGRFADVRAWGFCSCGWEGSHRLWWVPGVDPTPQALIKADVADHEAETGHRDVTPGIPAPDGYHAACGAFHGFDDDCLTPPTSPAGRVHRATASALRDPVLAVDRLRAIQELRSWLDDQEAEAVIGCRMSRATWAEMGAAIGSSRQGAYGRWGAQIRRYENAGLIDPVEDGPIVRAARGR